MSTLLRHQSQLLPAENKFHVGNGDDGKHYWLYPPTEFAALKAEFDFTTDVCPWLGRPWQEGDWDGLTEEWGERNWCHPPFGSIMHQGKKKGPTAWMRKAIEERRKGKLSVIAYPLDKWVLLMAREILGDHADIRNAGDVRFCATEDGSQGKGTGRHIALFVLRPATESGTQLSKDGET